MSEKQNPKGLPGEPLWPLPPELDAWRRRRDGNAARILPTGGVVLCSADGIHRNYPTLTAACAAAVWVR